MVFRSSIGARAGFSILLAAFTCAVGCVNVPKRTPLPEALVDVALPLGIEGARAAADEPSANAEQWFAMSREEIKAQYPALFGKEHDYLAISGGGANGAFGAGVLCGWTASGTRPEFAVVTGISTGALTAPFAFLGSDYDETLKKLFTTITTKSILSKRILWNRFFYDAATSTKPLVALLERYIDDAVIQAIAEEHNLGRRLWVGTTNLDTGEPVVWSIGTIAASGHPGAPGLIRRVLLASASLPAAFPPVLIPVEAENQEFDELHVDGGAAAQVFFYPAGMDWKRVAAKLESGRFPDVYIIRNSRLEPQYKVVKNKLLPISGRTISSLIRTQGIGDLYRIYLTAQRDGLDFNLAYIPSDFQASRTEQFDPVYMKKLFDVGYSLARDGYPWSKAPPGIEE